MYLTVFCLTFQAFVQLQWSDESCTRIARSHWTLRFCSVPSRQNMWTLLSIIFFMQIHNDEYCMVLVAAVILSHTHQRCLLTVECGRYTVPWNYKASISLAKPIATPSIFPGNAVSNVPGLRRARKVAACRMDRSVNGYCRSGLGLQYEEFKVY